MNLPRAPRRIAPALALALAASIAPTASAPSAAAPSPAPADCATPWGSTTEGRPPATTRPITDVRSGRHTCYDRLVIDVQGPGRGRLGYRVAYVRHVHAEGSGDRVPLRGTAQLSITVKAPAYDGRGEATYLFDDPSELVDVDGYRTFRQVAWAGTHEGQTTLGLGTRGRLPFRVFIVGDGPGTRLVIDVGHSWT